MGPPGQDGDDGADGAPGVAGRDGASGSPSSSSAALMMLPLDGEDGQDSMIPGPAGRAGLNAPIIPGPAGDDGDDGWPGPPGRDGLPGLPGIMGMSGDDGDDGMMGFPGRDGAVGLAGIGVPGMDGEDGEDGFPGTAGARGLAGLMGPPGMLGDDGDDGPMGPPGLTGATGATGAAGATGSAGATGATGATGIGIPGMDGEDGDMGCMIPPYNPTATDIGPGVVTGHVYGFPLSYASATTVTVGTGKCRAQSDYGNISLTASGTISTGTLGAINGLDRTAIAGTVATNNATSTVTGTSTAFLTAFSPRAGTGTITTAGTAGSAGTTLLSQISVGDLVGTAAKGYGRVAAVLTNATFTLSNAIPGGDLTTSAFNIIENAHFQANAQTVRQVNIITSDTSLGLNAVSSATESGVTGYVGALPSVAAYLMVWVGMGASGTGVFLSTQRTTPFGISGYNVQVRRVGSVMWDGSAFIPFSQWGKWADRWYQFECAESGQGTRILTSGTATTWTAVVVTTVTPPTATALGLVVAVGTNASAEAVYVRSRGLGSATVSRPIEIANNVVTGSQKLWIPFWCACDGAQCFDYATINATASHFDCFGYQEAL